MSVSQAETELNWVKSYFQANEILLISSHDHRIYEGILELHVYRN